MRLVPLSACIIAALILAACSSNSTASSDIVARVNGKEIAASDLEKQFQSRVNSAEQVPSPEETEALKFQLLSQMINDRILLEMAESNDLSATDAEVDNKFTEIRTQYTEEQFNEMIKQQKMSVDDVKAEVRKTLTLEKLVNKEITSRIEVSDAEIKDFFDKNRESFNLPEAFHLAHIMVTHVPDQRITNLKKDDAKTPIEARVKATRLLREIQGGMDFAVVARDWSEDSDTAPMGGDLGFRSVQNLAEIHPNLSEAVVKLKVGETTPLVETPYGLHILKLIQKDAGGQKDLTNAQVQAQIRQVIFARKEEMLRAAFSETARNKAQVNNYLAERILENAGKVSVPSAAAPATPPAAAPAAPAAPAPEGSK